MPRTIQTGAPLALTEALANAIRRWRSDDPFGRVLVLAPDTSTAHALRDTLPLAVGTASGDGIRGLFNVEVESLTTWATLVSRPRLRADGHSILPRYASLAVVAAAVSATKDATGALAGVAAAEDPRDRPNFHRAVLSELITLKKNRPHARFSCRRRSPLRA